MDLTHLIETTGNTERFLSTYQFILDMLQIPTVYTMQDLRHYLMEICEGKIAIQLVQAVQCRMVLVVNFSIFLELIVYLCCFYT